ncbi:MAG: agmatinase family protein [Actinomycetota bacterium]
MSTSTDSLWPSAHSLLSTNWDPSKTTVALLGVPTFATSLTPRSSESTPAAVRDALRRYSTWSWTDEMDLSSRGAILDYGDVSQPDTAAGQRRISEAVHLVHQACQMLLILGGDNACTFTALNALSLGTLSRWGLITLDAHLDFREGASNGSPVRQLVDAGLPGSHIVQVGVADFSNSPAYAAHARDAGITHVGRDALRRRPIEDVLDDALSIAGRDGRPVYVDVDLDVADRSLVPACPAAAPGGLSADELRRAVRHLSRHPQVRAMDFTEVDVARDSADQRTVRLVALLVLESLAGVIGRNS